MHEYPAFNCHLDPAIMAGLRWLYEIIGQMESLLSVRHVLADISQTAAIVW